MRKPLRQSSALLVPLVILAGFGWAGEPPTSPSVSLRDDLSEILRRRVEDYQPWIDGLRKRSSTEIQKLQQWEYTVVAVQTSDPSALSAALNHMGKAGWECFHVVSASPTAPGILPKEYLLFFRKRAGSWLSQIPVRDLIKMLMFLASESEPERGGP